LSRQDSKPKEGIVRSSINAAKDQAKSEPYFVRQTTKQHFVYQGTRVSKIIVVIPKSHLNGKVPLPQ
jgi:hypothetical protein